MHNNQRLEKAKRNQPDYHANPEIQGFIEKIDLVAVVGITQAGKSALINELIRLYPDKYYSVVSYTSRVMRPHETPESMHFVTDLDHELEDIEKGNYVQYTVHPTKGDLYGTKPDSYDLDKINLAPMLSSVMEKLESIGFGQLRTVAIVPEVDGWKNALMAIGFTPEELQKRLAEARLSLEWCLDHAERMVWFEKDYGDLTANAQRLHEALAQPPRLNEAAVARAGQLLTSIKQLMNRGGSGNTF